MCTYCVPFSKHSAENVIGWHDRSCKFTSTAVLVSAKEGTDINRIFMPPSPESKVGLDSVTTNKKHITHPQKHHSQTWLDYR